MAAEVTDISFEEDVLLSTGPVVVDFWAEWCPPCRAIEPLLEELSAEFAGKVRIAKMNTDDNPRTAVRYGVRSIPTLILFKDGELTAIQVGAASKSRLAQWINKGL